ncbi:unnamed protein product, partial [Prunus brigantina]
DHTQRKSLEVVNKSGLGVADVDFFMMGTISSKCGAKAYLANTVMKIGSCSPNENWANT